MGETSGSAIRTLSIGKPLVVSDVGWFAELPGEVALKVPAGGEGEVEAIAAALRRLAEPGVAAGMGDAAHAYVEREHDLDRVAERYVAALEEAGGRDVVEAKILREVAEAAAGIGIAASAVGPELAALSLVTPDGRGPYAHARPSAPGAVSRAVRSHPLLWLGGLYVAAVVIQLSLALRVVSPWIMVDELVYSDMARSFARTGHFLLRDTHASYGFVYPLLLSPVYLLFGPVAHAYEWARVVNSLVMCSVVLPTYLLARRVVREVPALLAAALSVGLPPLVYTGTLMTENAFYPVFAWLAFALVLALERPTVRRQVVVVALCAVAFLTRAQAVALVASVLTAPLLLAWIERGRPRRLGAWKPLYGLTAAGAVVILVIELARGRSPSQALGGYSVTTNGGSYHVWPSIRWVLYHVAALDLSLWILPFAALIVLVANARHLDRALRIFSAAAVALTVWLVLEVGVFASAWSQRIEERNLFYTVPLFLIALFAWIERGQPRPPRAAVAAAGVAAALPAAIPFASLINITATLRHARPAAVVVPRRPLGRAATNVARRGRDRRRLRSLLRFSGCRDATRRCCRLLVAAGFLVDLVAAAALDAQSSTASPRAAYSTGIDAAAELDRPPRSDVTRTSRSVDRRQPVPRLGERVLESQRRARLRLRLGRLARGRR